MVIHRKIYQFISDLTPTGKVTNYLSALISLKMERSEQREASRQNFPFFYFLSGALLRYAQPFLARIKERTNWSL